MIRIVTLPVVPIVEVCVSAPTFALDGTPLPMREVGDTLKFRIRRDFPGVMSLGLFDPDGGHEIVDSLAPVADQGPIAGVFDPIEIEDPGCVVKSFPGFWDEFERFRRHHLQGGDA